MKTRWGFGIMLLTLCVGSPTLYTPPPVSSQGKPGSYYPAPGDRWQHRSAEAAGMNSALLEQAVAYV